MDSNSISNSAFMKQKGQGAFGLASGMNADQERRIVRSLKPKILVTFEDKDHYEY